jgi:hypothetical protein
MEIQQKRILKGEFNMRYQVNAYLCTNFSYLVDTLKTDDFYEVQDFIEANCQNGYNCILIDNERNTNGWIYADDFMSDLRMEQCEQM